MKKELKNYLAKLSAFLPDNVFCKITFLIKNKRFPNLKSPVLFNDKLLKIKLEYRNPIQKTLVDKFAVRKHIEEKIGREFLVGIIGVYDEPEDIVFKKLPNKFALKITNGSQHNLICTDKKKINWVESKKNINSWLNQNFYERTREWPYKGLKNRILIEEYLDGGDGTLDDYKFWCFNGEPKILQIDSDRFIDHKRDFYDVDLKTKFPMRITYKNSNNYLSKPDNYSKMLDVCRNLSKEFDFVRVDLYNIKGKIIFGEITFYPGNCNEKFSERYYENMLGSYLKLYI